MTVGAVIVAAGLSSRMGAFKPLMELGGRPIIHNEVEQFLACGVAKLVIVTGHNAERLEEILALQGNMGGKVLTVFNPDYARSEMFRSVQIGVAALPEEVDAFFFLPADCPAVSEQTLRRLLQAAKKGDALFYTPVCGGRKGHPPLISSDLIPALLAYDGTGGLKAFLRAYPGKEIQVNDAEILRDMDLPEDYIALAQSFLDV